jgi:tetratricopeptide (TPR) repeat protein
MKEALTLDPQHPDVLVSYGFLCLAVGDPEGARLALEHLESSSTEHPGSVALRKALKEVNTALVRKDEIRLQVEEAQQQEDWPQAITRLEQLLKIPDLTAEEAASYWNSLGYAYIMDDQLNAAEAAFLQGLKSRADQLDLLSNLADLYLQQAKFEEATEYLKRALTVDANDINVLLSLGNCCVELEAFDTALEAFQRVESLAPETLAVRDVIEQLESIVLT